MEKSLVCGVLLTVTCIGWMGLASAQPKEPHYVKQPITPSHPGDRPGGGSVSAPAGSPVAPGTRFPGVGTVGMPEPAKPPSGGAGGQGFSAGGGVNGPKGATGGGGSIGANFNSDDGRVKSGRR